MGKRAEYLIFISYGTGDKFIAGQMERLIHDNCAGLGITTYLDERDIGPGESIQDSVRANLKKCDEFLLLLTKHSAHRQWVLSELGAAWVLGKRIVAVVYQLAPEEVPEIIGQYRRIDLNKFEDYVSDLRQRARQ